MAALEAEAKLAAKEERRIRTAAQTLKAVNGKAGGPLTQLMRKKIAMRQAEAVPRRKPTVGPKAAPPQRGWKLEVVSLAAQSPFAGVTMGPQSGILLTTTCIWPFKGSDPMYCGAEAPDGG